MRRGIIAARLCRQPGCIMCCRVERLGLRGAAGSRIGGAIETAAGCRATSNFEVHGSPKAKGDIATETPAEMILKYKVLSVKT